jgi:hypothetical protein
MDAHKDEQQTNIINILTTWNFFGKGPMALNSS